MDKGDKIALKSVPTTGETNAAIFTFGRFQPPHLGHSKLIQYVHSISDASLTPFDFTESESSNESKITVARQYQLSKDVDGVPSPNNIKDSMKRGKGVMGDSYVFVSKSENDSKTKERLYKNKKMGLTYEKVRDTLNSSNDQVLKDKIKKTFGNPLTPEDKIRLMRLQYERLGDLRLINTKYCLDEAISEDESCGTIQSIISRLLNNNYNKIILVLGEDRLKGFEKFLPKTVRESLPDTLNAAELILVGVGRDETADDPILSLSASKVRKLALNIDLDNYESAGQIERIETLKRSLIPDDASESVKTKMESLLPEYIMKIQNGYKPNQSGGRKRRNVSSGRQHKSLKYRRMRGLNRTKKIRKPRRKRHNK